MYIFPEKIKEEVTEKQRIHNIRVALQAPFKEDDIEWRVGSCGITRDKPWVRPLAYITARAVQNRLDDCVGVDRWTPKYTFIGNDVLCNLSIDFNEKGDPLWVSKEDGADKPDFEPFKGGVSDALKRVAASGYGIGRYLYYLDSSFAKCQLQASYDKGVLQCKDKTGKTIYWMKPPMPSWALPKVEKKISDFKGPLESRSSYYD